MASQQEIQEFLGLRRDEEATEFVEEFWRRRDPRPEEPGNPLRQLFENRAEEADRRFREAGYVGRRTARGTLWVLYGAPEKTEFELHPRAGEPPIEVWRYARDAPRGLDGRQPRLVYRFTKRDDLTVAYDGPAQDGPQPPGRPGSRPPGTGWPR
jgi:GWxTD domain-containing protein